MEEEKLYPRRWAILIGMTCILIAIQFNNILPGGAAIATMQAYGIQPMMFSMIMSAPYLSGFLFAILAGVMADRIGLNKILMAGFVAGLVGAIIRVFSVGNFALIIVAMIILGFAVACLNANSAKLLRDWFPGKANAFAMGVYTAGMTFGAAFALWYGSAAVPPASDAALAADPAAAIESVGQSLQQAWIVGAVFIAVGIVIWIICYRKHPAVELNKEPVGQYMKEVLKNPAVWGISIFALLVFGGATNINSSYMVAAISTLAGGPQFQAEAGQLSTINTILGAVFSMLLPTVFARFFKKMRGPVWICALVTAGCFALIYFLPYGPMTWVLYIIQPIAMASLMPFVKMAPTLLPGVEREQLGVIGGIQATFQNIGMFLIGPHIISPLDIAFSGAADGLAYYQAIYIGTAIVTALIGVSMYMFPNIASSLGNKAIEDKEAAQTDK